MCRRELRQYSIDETKNVLLALSNFEDVTTQTNKTDNGTSLTELFDNFLQQSNFIMLMPYWDFRLDLNTNAPEQSLIIDFINAVIQSIGSNTNTKFFKEFSNLTIIENWNSIFNALNLVNSMNEEKDDAINVKQILGLFFVVSTDIGIDVNDTNSFLPEFYCQSTKWLQWNTKTNRCEAKLKNYGAEKEENIFPTSFNISDITNLTTVKFSLPVNVITLKNKTTKTEKEDVNILEAAITVIRQYETIINNSLNIEPNLEANKKLNTTKNIINNQTHTLNPIRQDQTQEMININNETELEKPLIVKHQLPLSKKVKVEKTILKKKKHQKHKHKKTKTTSTTTESNFSNSLINVSSIMPLPKRLNSKKKFSSNYKIFKQSKNDYMTEPKIKKNLIKIEKEPSKENTEIELYNIKPKGENIFDSKYNFPETKYTHYNFDKYENEYSKMEEKNIPLTLEEKRIKQIIEEEDKNIDPTNNLDLLLKYLVKPKLPKGIILWKSKNTPIPLVYFTITVIKGPLSRRGKPPMSTKRRVGGARIYLTGLNMPTGYTQVTEGNQIKESNVALVRTLNPRKAGPFVEFKIRVENKYGTACKQMCLSSIQRYRRCNRKIVRLSTFKKFSDPIPFFQSSADAIDGQWTGRGYYKRRKYDYLLFRCD